MRICVVLGNRVLEDVDRFFELDEVVFEFVIGVFICSIKERK